MKPFLEYLKTIERKGERTRLCRAVGTTEGYVRKAASVGQLPSPATCVAIERETGGDVPRQKLRPDDWPAIWPELKAAGKQAA